MKAKEGRKKGKRGKKKRKKRTKREGETVATQGRVVEYPEELKSFGVNDSYDRGRWAQKVERE